MLQRQLTREEVNSMRDTSCHLIAQLFGILVVVGIGFDPFKFLLRQQMVDLIDNCSEAKHKARGSQLTKSLLKFVDFKKASTTEIQAFSKVISLAVLSS